MPPVITIKDIAKRASVGVSTVSRVLNNHPDVSAETSEKVLKIAGELKYRADSRARQLVKDTTETICFIMSNREVMNPFHSHVLAGVERYSRSLSHNVIFMRYDYAPDIKPSELVLPRLILERGTVDGLIIAGMNYPNFIKAIQKLKSPFVLFGNNLIGESPLKGTDTVWFDNEGGTSQATEYLIGLGHRDIWFLADLTLPWYQRCYSGYVQAMKRHRLKPLKLDLTMRGSPFDLGSASVDFIVKNRSRISAVVAGDDEIALGVLSGLKTHGVRVPQDICLVGFDDINDLKYFHPPLTTIRVPKERVGEELARALFERLSKPELPPIKWVLPTELVVRESCGQVRR
jgi:LacI family transcriptional regulator